MEEINDVKEEIKKDLTSLPYRVSNIAGATASVAVIALILYFFKIIPESVVLSIGLFTSLPIFFSFIFGIIFNKPNFKSSIKHYSFLAYIVISLVIFMIILSPSSATEGIKYFIHFFFGLVIAVISYIFYIIPFRLSKKLKYRWRALIGFGISFVITLIFVLVLNNYNIFDII